VAFVGDDVVPGKDASVSAPTDQLPLSGVRVIDAANELGGYGGRLLADLGADVVKLEPPGGLAGRRVPPFLGDQPGENRSLGFLYREANKRGAVLDVGDPAAEEQLRRLAQGADIVLITPTPDAPVAGLDVEGGALSWAPHALVVAITPFGLTGPLRGWRATPLISSAMSAQLVQQGPPEGPPIVVPGDQLWMHTGIHAAVAALAMLRERESGQRAGGRLAEVSAHEVLTASNMDYYAYPALGLIRPRTGPSKSENGGPFDVADGRIEFIASTDKHWNGLMELLGHPEELGDPAWGDPAARVPHRELIVERLTEILAGLDRETVVEQGQRRGLPVSLINTIGEFTRDPQPRSRGFFVEAPLPDGGRLEMPGAVYRSWEPMLGLYRRPAPRLGQSSAEELAREWAEPAPLRPKAQPLSGIRVISFGTAIAGAFSSSVLGDLGADVVKLESPTKPDNLRRLLSGPGDRVAQEPHGGWTSYMFANHNRDERGLSMDLKDPAAVALFTRLAAAADVIIDNFSPLVMGSWGLGHERLAEINPRLIQLSLTGFGHSGPRMAYLAYGSTVSGFSGLTRAWGSSHGVHYDYISEAHGVLAVLAALSARDRTGRGTFLDLAEVEVAGVMMPTLVLDYLANGRDAIDLGNAAPGSVWSGVVPAPGRDAYVVVDVRTAGEWDALVAAIGRPELAGEPGDAERAALEAAFGEWVQARTPLQAARTLQAVGVPAAPAQSVEELYRDPQLRARGSLVEIPHPDLGTAEFPAPVHRLDGRVLPVRRGAPRLGGDGDAVLEEWLGLDRAERDALAEAGAFWRGSLPAAVPAG